MSEENITTPGNELHQLEGPGPGFNCTGIIEQVIEQTSAKHANTRKQTPANEQNYRSSSWYISFLLLTMEFHSRPANISLWARILLSESYP